MELTKYQTMALEDLAVDGPLFEELANVDEVVYPVDYSDNSLVTRMQTEFPLVNWILNTESARAMQAKYNSGNAPILPKDENGLYKIQMPFSVWTTPPEDTTGECCWVPMGLDVSGGTVPIYMVCLKYCQQILDEFISKHRRFGSNDLINAFQREGETVSQAQERMNRLSMAWFTAHTIVLGTPDTTTPVLKPFHGLMSVMEQKDVLKLAGAQILAAFDSLKCRMVQLEQNDFTFFAHPLTIEAIKGELVEGKNGKLPEGWRKSDNGDIWFNGHAFIGDKMIPIDLTAGTGEVWMLDGKTCGGFMATTLSPSDEFVRETFDDNNKPADGCAGGCKYYYNYGTTWCSNPNTIAVITDIPLSANCTGGILNGLDNIIIPNTIVPTIEHAKD